MISRRKAPTIEMFDSLFFFFSFFQRRQLEYLLSDLTSQRWTGKSIWATNIKVTLRKVLFLSLELNVAPKLKIVTKIKYTGRDMSSYMISDKHPELIF